MPALSAARGDSGALEHAAFLEGDEAVVAEDDVVEEIDAEELAALAEALGDAAIFGAKSWPQADFAASPLRDGNSRNDIAGVLGILWVCM